MTNVELIESFYENKIMPQELFDAYSKCTPPENNSAGLFSEAAIAQVMGLAAMVEKEVRESESNKVGVMASYVAHIILTGMMLVNSRLEGSNA
jgi:hypothetical protein